MDLGKDAAIEWTQATLSLGWGCRKVASACKNCYMFRLSDQFKIPTEPRKLDIGKQERELQKWKHKTLIFVNDMTDSFGEFYSFDLIEQWHQLFERHPDKQFQLLTKRIGRAMLFYRRRPVPRNVWVGCSIGEKSRLFRLEQIEEDRREDSICLI